MEKTNEFSFFEEELKISFTQNNQSKLVCGIRYESVYFPATVIVNGQPFLQSLSTDSANILEEDLILHEEVTIEIYVVGQGIVAIGPFKSARSFEGILPKYSAKLLVSI